MTVAGQALGQTAARRPRHEDRSVGQCFHCGERIVSPYAGAF